MPKPGKIGRPKMGTEQLERRSVWLAIAREIVSVTQTYWPSKIILFYREGG